MLNRIYNKIVLIIVSIITNCTLINSDAYRDCGYNKMFFLGKGIANFSLFIITTQYIHMILRDSTNVICDIFMVNSFSTQAEFGCTDY